MRLDQSKIWQVCLFRKRIISTYLLSIFQLQSNEISCCVRLPLTFFFTGKRPSARSPASAPEARRGHEGVRGLERRRTRNWSQGQSRLRRRRPQQAEVLAARVERHSTGLGKRYYQSPPAACFFSLSVRKWHFEVNHRRLKRGQP